MWGGGGIAAAHRIGCCGIDFFAQGSLSGLREADEEARIHGRDPGMTILPDKSTPSAVFIFDDPDEAWMNSGSTYSTMLGWTALGTRATSPPSGSHTHKSVEELRRSDSHVILTPDQVDDLVTGPNPVPTLMPLCGGLPSTIAWKYFKRAAAGLTA
jgi:hypothetical protein